MAEEISRLARLGTAQSSAGLEGRSIDRLDESQIRDMATELEKQREALQEDVLLRGGR